MAVSNKDLKPGDVLLTSINEAYIYLGYYKGTPICYPTIYTWPNEGYLYIFLDYIGFMADNVIEQRISDNAVCHNILVRSQSGIDGNAAYTKQYKKFEKLLRHADLSKAQAVLNQIYGLRRIGDKKPGKKEACPYTSGPFNTNRF